MWSDVFWCVNYWGIWVHVRCSSSCFISNIRVIGVCMRVIKVSRSFIGCNVGCKTRMSALTSILVSI